MRARKIAAAEIHILVDAVGQDENLPAVHAERLEQTNELRRLGGIVVKPVDDEQRFF